MAEDPFFHVLHIEDDPNEAAFLEDGQYSGIIKDAVDQTLKAHAFPVEDVRWDIARSAKEAIEKIATAERDRPGRGFDAVFSDMSIYRERVGDALSTENGLRVLRALRDYEWPGAVVVVSAWAEDGPLISRKEELRDELRLDEWLFKGDFSDSTREQGTPAATLAKLRRCLVPLEAYARKCRSFKPPAIFINKKMRRLLRDLVVLAEKAVREDGKDYGWPLTRVLLLGEPGCGKGMLARAFYEFLPHSAARRSELVTVNCASLVAGQSHGGMIRLFGVDNFQGMRPQSGAFEQATSYLGLAQNRLAGPSEKIAWSRAGVVFLDEFVELNPDIQAAILNALEEGVVHREGSARLVPIGCHIVFATNASTDEILERGRVRRDLLDRIPHVLTVPPLRDRLDEIRPLIEGMVSYKLSRLGAKSQQVDLSPSAEALLRNAVKAELIASVRQLQVIADVELGEATITDSNLAPLFAKAALLRLTDVLTKPSGAVPISTKAQMLGLPQEFSADRLPPCTDWAIGELYGRKMEEREVRPKEKMSCTDEEWDTLVLMSRLLRPEDAARLCAPPGAKDPKGALRAARKRAAERLGVDIGLHDKNVAAEKQAITEFLTTSK